MARRLECMAPSTRIAVGDELARAHDVESLILALSTRLRIHRYQTLAGLIRISAREEARGPYVRAALFGTALIARLRVERRGDLADALVSSLSGGPLEVDPVLWLSEPYALIAIGRQTAERLRTRGRHEEADELASDLSWSLRNGLVARLRADGHDDLANAVWLACVDAERSRQDASGGLPVTSPRDEPHLGVVDTWMRTEALGRAQPADVLAYALVTRLRAEGREVLAGSIMMSGRARSRGRSRIWGDSRPISSRSSASRGAESSRTPSLRC